ncbi:MAG: TetR/AcrR family transcriptional regulator, partial [Actinomycetes bacterium]
MTITGDASRRAKGEARERLILSSAAELIAERGLANVKVADIAQRAGMSSGHVTYYFPSKTHLLMRAIQNSERALHDDVVEKVERIRDPWKRLYRLLDLASSSGRGDPGWVLWFEVWASAGLDPVLAEMQAELDARWRRTLTDVIRYGCASGVFATDDPDGVSTLLSSLVDGLSVHVTLGDDPIDGKAMRALCIRAAEAHLRPPR